MKRLWRPVGAVLAVALFVSPAALAFHGASHWHEVDETVECSLCILDSHFAAEIQAVADVDFVRPVTAIPLEDFTPPTTKELRQACVRGPPVTSV